MKNISTKVVLVTGAASGIGYEIARAFAGRGSRVILADVDVPSCEAAANRIVETGGDAIAISLDVADPASWAEAVSEIETAAGAIDILCNNAGVGHTGKKLTELTFADWTFISSVNIGGILNGIHHIVPGMLDRGEEAHVVNTSSILGHFALPGAADYVATKFAALGLSEALRMELAGSRIGVSVLCPGLVDTRLRESTRSYRRFRNVSESTVVDVGNKPQNGISAAAVGDVVVEAVLANDFYIFTHPEYIDLIDKRFDALRKALSISTSIGEADNLTHLGSGVLNNWS